MKWLKRIWESLFRKRAAEASKPAKKRYRSAITGMFVKRQYADKHPRTTVGEK